MSLRSLRQLLGAEAGWRPYPKNLCIPWRHFDTFGVQAMKTYGIILADMTQTGRSSARQTNDGLPGT